MNATRLLDCVLEDESQADDGTRGACGADGAGKNQIALPRLKSVEKEDGSQDLVGSSGI